MDERYVITEEEKKKILEVYFKQGIDERLDVFPSKEKRKLIVMKIFQGILNQVLFTQKWK
ncbi:hypothetical protein JNUCC74_01715 [Cerasibacillus sp. JNUCC 74]